jgi:hypothetical protein
MSSQNTNTNSTTKSFVTGNIGRTEGEQGAFLTRITGKYDTPAQGQAGQGQPAAHVSQNVKDVWANALAGKKATKWCVGDAGKAHHRCSDQRCCRGGSVENECVGRRPPSAMTKGRVPGRGVTLHSSRCEAADQIWIDATASPLASQLR